MTGHGQALDQNSQVRVLAEVRSVNNRFLKTHINCDFDVNRQSQLENLVKQHVSRGNVNLKVRAQKLQQSQHYKLNEPVLRAYWLQLSEIAGSSQSVNLESILQLPGVIEENIAEDSDEVWEAVQQAVSESLAKLTEMRSLEGAAMEKDMRQNCSDVSEHLQRIRELAPGVIENYSQKITDRINGLLAKHDITGQPTDIIKEVGIFAERVDISEEIVRLDSHLEQFRKVLDGEQSNGRKLDFLVQEMLRESNTIGSKANDAEIATRVVAIKTAIERIREMVQNVE